MFVDLKTALVSLKETRTDCGCDEGSGAESEKIEFDGDIEQK